jgi:hypothetical protein
MPNPPDRAEYAVSTEIDYEIAQHETFSERARHLGDVGHCKAARLFETLSDLCFDKAALFRQIELILISQLRAGAQLWEESHRACAAGCSGDDIQYEVERYELYATYAFSFQEMGSRDEADVFQLLADVCYEKATLFMEIESLVHRNGEVRWKESFE